MKLKKILLQLGLLLAFVGVGMVGNQLVALANPSGVPSSADILNGGGITVYRDSANLVGNSTNDSNSTSYPSMSDVYANYVKNGRLTSKTTAIYVQFSTTMNLSNKLSNYTSVYADVTWYDGSTVHSLVKNPQNWLKGSTAKSATPPTGYIEMDVDLSSLGSGVRLPIYIGFSYGYNYNGIYPGTAQYWWMSLDSDPAITKNIADVTIDGGGTVSSSANEVTGTGEPGYKVYLADVSNSYVATVGDDGKYTIPLGAGETVKSVSGSKVKVTEYNDFGDNKSATADVVDSVPLTITPATSNLTVNPDDWDKYIKGQSSTDIAKWLSTQASLVVTKPDSSTPLTAGADGDGLSFDTATDLSSLAAGDTQAVQVTASDTAGDKSTDSATINVTRGLGTMQFTTISQLVFGNGATLAVPSTQTLYAPGNYDVDVSDSRAMGSPWYLTAKASTLTDGDGGHTFSGHVVYADGNGTVTPLDAGNAVQVGSGTRSSSTYDLASSWNQKGNSYTGSSAPAGVYLQANPNVYAGSATAYSGTMTWTLADTPDVK